MKNIQSGGKGLNTNSYGNTTGYLLGTIVGRATMEGYPMFSDQMEDPVDDGDTK